jgi:hypothetical protein
MRSLLDIEIKRQREGRERRESPNRAPCTKFKVGQIGTLRDGGDSDLTSSSVGAKGAASGGKDYQI